MGRITGGSLHRDYQFVCFEQSDALRGETLSGQDKDTDQVRMALMNDGRCALTGAAAGYDMTADGKERFTTPHGVVDLYAAHDYSADTE
jgi:hypothetical protein